MRRVKGFTLVELIVVVAIIAILAAVVTPNAFRAIEKAKISSTIADIKAIRAAAYDFYTDTGTLPCTKAGGWGADPGFVRPITPSNCWPNEGGCNQGCTNISGWDGPYLEKWPQSGRWLLGGGGKYNWNRWPNFIAPGTAVRCSLAGIVTLEVYGAISVKALQEIDRVLDDGNLSSGYVWVEGPINNPSYLQCLVTCH
ncbi:MAG: type II secretion system GspH family protein [Candidatus Omnitrophica bacterium]|nr:type II secretion system GspH family protein [Candidatus Omnitrophota bacterium]